MSRVRMPYRRAVSAAQLVQDDTTEHDQDKEDPEEGAPCIMALHPSTDDDETH